CGYTPQYEGLEKLYENMEKSGVVVLGFPSNEFGGQEPGTAEQIETFCRSKFGVKFPMFEKVDTKGAKQHPVYAFLTKEHGVPSCSLSSRSLETGDRGCSVRCPARCRRLRCGSVRPLRRARAR